MSTSQPQLIRIDGREATSVGPEGLRSPTSTTKTPLRDERLVRVIAAIVLLAAWWSLVRLILHFGRSLDLADDVFAYVGLPVDPSLFSAVLLFSLAGAVRRRMRAAWWVLIGFQAVALLYAVAALTHLQIPDQAASDSASTITTVVNLATSSIVLVILLRSRGAFTSLIASHSWLRALVVLIGGLGLSLATSLTLTLSAPYHLSDTMYRIHWAIRVVFGSRPDRSDIGWAHEFGHPWIASLAGTLSGLTLLAALVIFMRSVRKAECVTAQDELALRGLLARYGDADSLGYFATRRDKSIVFAPEHAAAITYRVIGSVCLASADPIGPHDQWPSVIKAWLREASAYGWYPAVVASSEAGARAFVAAGLTAIPMGDEAIIDTESFSLTGPDMQPVRRAAHRIKRLGYTITVQRHEDLAAAQLTELADLADRWRVGGTERGFSMALGRLDDAVDGRSVAVLAHDVSGQLRGFLSLVPWGQRGLSLDLMRRDRSSDNGVNEAMVAALVQDAREQFGVTRVSLNFAMFRGVFSAAEQVGVRPLVGLTSRVMRLASRYWQIESLYRSNARYQPAWETRYLCCDSTLTLTRVALAAGVAEGFVPTFGDQPRPHSGGDSPVVLSGRTMALADAIAEQEELLRESATTPPRPSQQERGRLAKLADLRAAGIDPYPMSVPRDIAIAELRTAVTSTTTRVVSVVGRIRALRDFGRLVFAVIEEDGATVQAIFTTHDLGDRHALARRALDLGDLLAVTGEVTTSRSGEPSLRVREWQLAAKCLTPVPKLRPPVNGLARRQRSRQVELMIEPRARQLLADRAALVGALRATLADDGFLEVDTPMLQAVHGGANARPFATRSNALDMPLFLRIAPELHLKRLCVAGMGRIYELNHNFRNEGVDDTHHPEFTSLEAYQPYADYLEMADVTYRLLLASAVAVHGAPVARRTTRDGRVVQTDLSIPWPRVRVHDAVSAACETAIDADTPAAQLATICRDHAIPARADATAGQLVVDLYENLVEARTTSPTFYLDFPVETSPLTRPHRRDARLAERWDLVAWGQEIGTAYSELTDPLEQRARLTRQSLRRAGGDVDAMQVDEDFLHSLGYGMPPTGGLGLGVDRILMMLTGATIRETLAFPLTTRTAAGPVR